MTEGDETRVLLGRWHAGDLPALHALIARDLPWVSDYVHARLGPLLRARGETQDYVQEAMLDVLRDLPRFVTANKQAFRGLVARIVENQLRDQHDFHRAQRRAPDRERGLASDSVLDLDTPVRSVTEPGEAAARGEQEAWVRLALELLEPDDRRVVLLRQWEELEFAEIGRRLAIGEDAARMRFQRALPKLARKLEDLRAGRAI